LKRKNKNKRMLGRKKIAEHHREEDRKMGGGCII
jgi:hypothetical protein